MYTLDGKTYAHRRKGIYVYVATHTLHVLALASMVKVAFEHGTVPGRGAFRQQMIGSRQEFVAAARRRSLREDGTGRHDRKNGFAGMLITRSKKK